MPINHYLIVKGWQSLDYFALCITRMMRLFFNTADVKCMDKKSVADNIVLIATKMLTNEKVHIKGE